MVGSFKEIDVKELKENPFKLIGEDWMFRRAGTPGDFNSMTASWGGLGFMWNKNIATCGKNYHTFYYGEIERCPLKQ